MAKKRKEEKPGKRKQSGMSRADRDSKYVQIGSPFADVSEEEMGRFRNELSQFHENRFERSMTRIQELIGSVDPLYLLIHVSVTNLYVGISDTGHLSTSWDTPKVPQPGIELLQALILQNSLPVIQEPTSLPHVLNEIYDLLPQALDSFAFKRVADLSELVDDEAKSILLLQESLRLHTQQVRNWGYYSQSLDILKKLYGPIDSIFQRLGIMTASKVISLFEGLIKRAELSVAEHRKRLGPTLRAKTLNEAVRRYHQAFDLRQSDAEDLLCDCRERGFGLEEAKFLALLHSFLHLDHAFVTTIEDLTSNLDVPDTEARKTVDALGICFGELQGHNSEFFFLNNPVWTRPLIRLDGDTFFCPLPTLFTGFAFRILDGLCAHDADARMAVESRRAQFLEEAVETLLCHAFPEGKIFRNIRWRDGSIEYETDLLVVVDSYLIIVEAKSGAVSWPALRGAPDRTRKHITQLIVEPSVQSKRLEERIRLLMNGKCGDDFFVTPLGLDFTSIWEVARLSVTLEDFATIQANVENLRRTGWLPEDFDAAPTMSLADLQTVLCILPSVPERLYYLVERAKVQKHVHYDGDELDLLGYYLETGFCDGPLGAGDETLFLHSMSSKVDQYMVARDAGANPDKPRREMTKWWRDILAQVESSRPSRWSEVELILLTLGLEAQQELEKRVQKLKRLVKSLAPSAIREDFVILLPDGHRKDAFAVIAMGKTTVSERHARIQGVAEEAFLHCQSARCLVLVLSVDIPRYPYQTLAVAERPN